MKNILSGAVAVVMAAAVKALAAARAEWVMAADAYSAVLEEVDIYREESAGKPPAFLYPHFVRMTAKAEQACRILGEAEASLRVLQADLAVAEAEAEMAEAPEWTQGRCAYKSARLALLEAKKAATAIPTFHDRMEVRGWHCQGGNPFAALPPSPSPSPSPSPREWPAPFPCSWDLGRQW